MPLRPTPAALDRLLCDVEQTLQSLRAAELFRTTTPIEAIDGVRVRIGGRWLINFSSNDYLGLSTHRRLIAAAANAAVRWGVGARASRLLAGTTVVHEQLEAALARWIGAEAAVVYSSGYLTNLGTLRALLREGDVAVVDRLAHASLIEACRGSGARLLVFAHNDPEQAARAVRRPRRGRAILITEGVFSMDGDRAPLAALAEVAARHDAILYVDDAHGGFAIGPTGRGSLDAAGVSLDAVVYMGALGKALGCQGGFIAGPRPLIEWLRNRARSFIYSTALATPVAAAALAALRLLRDHPAPRRRLEANVRDLHRRLREAGLPAPSEPGHILPIFVGATSEAQRVAAAVRARGVFAPAIRPPTVPAGTARLRLSLTSRHTDEQLAACVAALRSAGLADRGR